MERKKDQIDTTRLRTFPEWRFRHGKRGEGAREPPKTRNYRCWPDGFPHTRLHTVGMEIDMGDSALRHRLASREDIAAMAALMDAAIGELQKPFLDETQISASRTIMGLDTQLVDDGTYFVVELGDALAGCGGWSRRATMYGGDRSPGRDAGLLDPAKDAARVRAMYTHPAFVRRGIGRLILDLCESAARAEGFARVELAATMAGEPLYRACGYQPIERFIDDRGGAAVPLVRMGKAL